MGLTAYLELDRTRGYIVLTAHFVRGFVDELKSTIHHSGRVWDQTTKKWLIAVSYKDILINMLVNHYDNIEFLDQSLMPKILNTTNPHYSILHIQEDAPWELVVAAYRCLCMLHHPDRGGSSKKMMEVNVAFAAIKQEKGK